MFVLAWPALSARLLVPGRRLARRSASPSSAGRCARSGASSAPRPASRPSRSRGPAQGPPPSCRRPLPVVGAPPWVEPRSRLLLLTPPG
eukprot:2535611-Pyramimonas_sp.AAC.1